jgi:predicted amidohydrolase YtcJ
MIQKRKTAQNWLLVFGAAAWWLGAAHGLFAQQTLSAIPDAVYYNGKIITVDSSSSVREAFAVRGDRFVAVGGNAEIRALAGPQTLLVDLQGKAVIPGLMDNHNHSYHAGVVMLRGIEMRGVPSLAEMLSRIRQAASTKPAGQAIYASMGWNANDFPEKRPPNRRDLDEAAPNHPVVVYQARGSAYVNGAALRAMGITRDTTNIGRATIEKDSAGEPTGAISGSPSAVMNPTGDITPRTHEEIKEHLLAVQKILLAQGLTSIRDLQIRPDGMRAYFDLWREGRLTMRVSMGLEVNPEDVDGLEELLRPWGVGTGFGDPWLRLDGIAEFNPGVYWRDTTIEPDQPNLPLEKYRQAILLINRAGWRASPHVEGDRTLDLVLDAYEAADRERSIRDQRWIVEHAAMVHPDQMERMKRLGVAVSAQIQPYRGAGNMVRSWGRERAERAVPMRELLDHGLIVSGGTDWPGLNLSPFANMYFYVTRNTLPLGPLGVAQKISRMEALRVETLNNAYLTREENIKGSIETGKLADFVILSEDFLTAPEEQIRSIQPLATYVGGQKLYARPGGGF